MTFEFLSFYDSQMVISQPQGLEESIQQLVTPGEALLYSFENAFLEMFGIYEETF